MTLRALVPLKSLALAKGRLAGVLTADERRRLALSMASHVLGVVRGAVDDAVLLTSEPIDDFPGARTMLDATDELNANLADAVRRLGGSAGDRVFIVFADLPALTPDDLAALIDAAGQGLAIAHDRLGQGVNAIGFTLPCDVRFCFGPGSRQGFEAEAARLGRPAVLVDRPGLGLDIDDGESLTLWKQRLEAGA
jgi:2-phospho-L-lactate guanylyltransferase